MELPTCFQLPRIANRAALLAALAVAAHLQYGAPRLKHAARIVHACAGRTTFAACVQHQVVDHTNVEPAVLHLCASAVPGAEVCTLQVQK